MHSFCYGIAVLTVIGAVLLIMSMNLTAGMVAFTSAVLIATLGRIAELLLMLVKQGERAEAMAKGSAAASDQQPRGPEGHFPAA